MLLGKDIDLLGAIGDLVRPFVDLPLQIYVLLMQLLVFLLQKSNFLLIFRLKLLQSFEVKSILFFYSELLLQSMLYLVQFSVKRIPFVGESFIALFQLCDIFKQILVLLVYLLNNVCVVIGDLASHGL